MNEVTRIHLGRQQFVLAVDAHKDLQQYLHAIERRVTDKEVVQEVELRMAELLIERGISGEKVVLKEDIAYLRQQLGEPSAFSEKPDEDQEVESTPQTRRLFRDTDNATIAGVCAGIAAFFGIQPLLVRIFFVLFTLLWGSGGLIYILLWILVPAAKTNSERLQMRGKPVTVDSLKELVAQADVDTAARRAGRMLQQVLRRSARMIAVVLGLILLIAGLLGMAGLVAITTYGLLHQATLLNGVAAFPVGPLETITVVAGLSLAAAIVLLTFCAGLSMLRRKWVLANWATTLVGLYMLVAIAAGAALVQDTYNRARERYNATRAATIHPLEAYDTFQFTGGPVSVRTIMSDDYKVEIATRGATNGKAATVKQSGKTIVVDVSAIDAEKQCRGICFTDWPEVTFYSPDSNCCQVRYE